MVSIPREIVVNGRFLTRHITGVERYAGEILHLLPGACRVERPAHPLNGALGHAWEQFCLPPRLHAGSLLWSPANTGPLLVSNQVLTIHDLSPLEHPEWFRASFGTWYRLFLPLLARRVRRIAVHTESIRQKVLRRFGLPPGKVRVIHPGVDTSKFHPGGVSMNMGRYALFVGTLEPRKNLQGLLAAWDGIQARHPDVSLVIAGSPGKVFREASHAGLHERVHWLGYVPDDDLPALYRGAELLVLPSLDEGFGLTALEAMASGTPVIASDGGALPELIGDAGLIFGLSDPQGLSVALDRCLSDTELRNSLRDKGLTRAQDFSWQRSAESLWEVLREI